MRKFLLSFSLLFVMIGNLIAQSIPVDPSIRIGKLENGMKYYIKKNTKPEKKVEFRLAINAGSLVEDNDQKGLAHFMEHMNFNGTKNFPDNKLVDFLQSIGVKFGQHLNAYTSFDETVYMLPVPLDKPGNLDAGLKVMEDWAFNALLTDKEINKERGVVLEELRLGLGPDKRMLDRYLPKLLYKSQYAERLPIGDKKILETFDPNVLRRFHKDWYRPNLMALIVVGDINVDEIEQKIKANFSKYTNQSTRERKIFDVPVHQETLVSVESDPDATFSRVQLVYKDLANFKPDTTVEEYNQNIVKNLFTTMLNNRLKELINSNNPPFTFGSTYHGGTYARSKEAFQSFAMTKEGGQLNALKVLMEETERAKRFGFTQGELDRAKAEMLSNLEKSYSNKDKTESEMYVDEFVRNFLEGESIPGIEWEFNQFKKVAPTVTLDQVNAVVKNMVRDENRVVVITGPKKENITQPTEAQVLSLFNEVKNAQLKPYEEKAAIKNLVAPFKSTGKIVKTETDAKLGTTTLTLSNGAKVTYKKTDFKEDEILFAARSLGGSSLISDADIVKTQFAFPALGEAGVNSYTKSDITKYMAGKQVSVTPSIGGLSTAFNGKTVKKDVGVLFEMVYAYFTGLNYDEGSFNAYKQKQSAIYSNLTSNPQFYFQNEVQKYLNQKNPRFTNIIPMEEDWKITDYKLAYQIFKEKVANAGNFHFYFIGNIDENQIKEYATQYLAALPTKNKAENFKDTGYRPLTTTVNKTIAKGKDPKSMVNIMFSGATKYDEKEDLALTALGEVATIKVIEKLREDEGGIYGGGARGSLNKVPYGSYNFNISFPCGPENVEKLTKIALAEIQKFADAGPEQKDLDKFKEAEANDEVTNQKDNSYWLNNIVNYQIEGGDKYEIINYLAKVKALTVKDLQAVAKKYLTKDKMVFTLMPEAGWEKNVKKEEKAVASSLTAQQVIDNYIVALGGKAKLEAVKTLKMNSVMKMMGMEISGTEIKMAPNKTKRTQSMMGQESVQVFDGTKGYMTQAGNKMDMPAPMVEKMKEARIIEALSMDAGKIKTVEKTTVDGKELIVMTSEKGKSFFDAKTGLLVKSQK
ncbi:MAG: insulinase family protein [Cloacibacterium sp.]|nr:insulinase family protein [Cloacibacterium sp.]